MTAAPITVTLLAFDYALGAAILGMHDLLYFAGSQANAIEENPSARRSQRFNLKIASPKGQSIRLMNQLSMAAHCSFDELTPSEVVLIPAMAGHPARTLAANPELIRFLKRVDPDFTVIGSNSSGSFFLAEAGLLDNRRCTTFWNDADDFEQRYPKVQLERQERLVRGGNIICDGGGSSWFDLGLYLVEQFCDHQTAVATAKYFMVDLERSAQRSFAPQFGDQQHKDQSILAVQNWLAAHYAESINLNDVAERFGLSSRSLVRRFKLATGMTPLHYLQELRLDAASRLLVQSRRSIEDITHAVGYQDTSSFIRLFKRRTDYSPSRYRARFQSV